MRLTRPLLFKMGAKKCSRGPFLCFKNTSLIFEKCRGGWNIYVDQTTGYNPFYAQTVKDLFNYIYYLGTLRGKSELCDNVFNFLHKTGEMPS